MRPEDFEKELQQRVLRRVPGEWREEILRAACSAAPPATEPGPSWLSTLSRCLAAWLWPSPKAWASLAAVWIVIVAVNFLRGSDDPIIAAAPVVAPPRQLLDVVREQRRELARLVESPVPAAADEPRTLSPRPRSDRHPDLRLT